VAGLCWLLDADLPRLALALDADLGALALTLAADPRAREDDGLEEDDDFSAQQ
jgi:hypothetical protein